MGAGNIVSWNLKQTAHRQSFLQFDNEGQKFFFFLNGLRFLAFGLGYFVLSDFVLVGKVDIGAFQREYSSLTLHNNYE